MPLSEQAIKLFSDIKAWIEPPLKAIGQRLEDFDARLKAIPAGAKGEPGESIKGDAGKGAYASAVDAGFVGTEMQWIESLKGGNGEKGEPGAQGIQGLAGAHGEKGDIGARGEQGMQGIQGEAGPNGLPGKDGERGKDADPAFVRQVVAEAVAAIPPAPAGKDGKDGKDGQDGANGKDVDMALVGQMIGVNVASAVDALPRAIDGKDADPAHVTAEVERQFAVMATEFVRGMSDD